MNFIPGSRIRLSSPPKFVILNAAAIRHEAPSSFAHGLSTAHCIEMSFFDLFNPIAYLMYSKADSQCLKPEKFERMAAVFGRRIMIRLNESSWHPNTGRQNQVMYGDLND